MRRLSWIVRLPLLASCFAPAVGCHSSTTTIVPETPIVVQQPAPVPGISLEQIVEMTRKNASPSVIITMIDRSGATFRLSVDEVNYLRQQGVDNSVIEHMLLPRSPQAAPPPPPGGAPPPAVIPVGYYAPAYYPAPYPYAYPYYGPAIGVGFYGGRRW